MQACLEICYKLHSSPTIAEPEGLQLFKWENTNSAVEVALGWIFKELCERSHSKSSLQILPQSQALLRQAPQFVCTIASLCIHYWISLPFARSGFFTIISMASFLNPTYSSSTDGCMRSSCRRSYL